MRVGKRQKVEAATLLSTNKRPQHIGETMACNTPNHCVKSATNLSSQVRGDAVALRQILTQCQAFIRVAEHFGERLHYCFV